MSWNKVLLPLVLFSVVFPDICQSATVEDPHLNIFESDEIARYFYDAGQVRILGNNVVSVRINILAKEAGNGSKLKMFSVGECPFDKVKSSDLVEIRGGIQIDCLNGKYRVTGGAFKDVREITICEPASESVKWIDIPLESPIHKLSKIICPK